MKNILISLATISSIIVVNATSTYLRQGQATRHQVLGPDQTAAGFEKEAENEAAALANDEYDAVQQLLEDEETLANAENQLENTGSGPIGHEPPQGNDPQGPPSTEEIQEKEDAKETAKKITELEKLSTNKQAQEEEKLKAESEKLEETKKKEAEEIFRKAGFSDNDIADIESSQ